MTNLDKKEVQKKTEQIVAMKTLARIEDYNYTISRNASIIEERQEKKIFAEIEKGLRENKRIK